MVVLILLTFIVCCSMVFFCYTPEEQDRAMPVCTLRVHVLIASTKVFKELFPGECLRLLIFRVACPHMHPVDMLSASIAIKCNKLVKSFVCYGLLLDRLTFEVHRGRCTQLTMLKETRTAATMDTPVQRYRTLCQSKMATAQGSGRFARSAPTDA